MEDVFMMLFVLSFIGLVLGLIIPRQVVFWSKERTRKKAAFGYGLVCFISFFIFGLTVDSPPMEQPGKSKAIQQPGKRKTTKQPVSKSSLTDKQKKQIYIEGYTDELKAMRQATKLYPSDLIKQATTLRDLTEMHQAALLKKYRITSEQDLNISVEALAKDWENEALEQDKKFRELESKN